MVLCCDVCDSTYERSYSKHHFDEHVHRCSRKCVYGSRSTDGFGGRGAAVVESSCFVCAKPLRFRKKGDERKWDRVCSRGCYGTYRSQYPELYAENTAAMHTLEASQKISEAYRHRASLSGYVHSRTGTHHSEETKRAISRHHRETGCLNGEKNGMFGKRHSEESRAKMSEMHSKLMIDGRMRCYAGNSRSRTYVSIRTGCVYNFKSGWEESVMRWLDKDDDVIMWDYECVRIPYYYNGNKRWYVPDFVVTFIDGHREMWEVKPKFHRNAEQVRLKAEAARAWCERDDVGTYQLLTGDVLREKGIIK